MKITRLEEKHLVIFDVHDRRSKDDNHSVLLPRLERLLEDNPQLKALVEIEVREE